MKYKLGKLKLKIHFLGHTSHILITCVALVTVLASAHHRFPSSQELLLNSMAVEN